MEEPSQVTPPINRNHFYTKGGITMSTKHMTTQPNSAFVACTNLDVRMRGLNRQEMANTSGGCTLPGFEEYEHNIIDWIEDFVSEWF